MKLIQAYQTTDGKQHLDFETAKHHQSKIDVIKKLKNSNFSLNWKSDVSDLMASDLSLIIELADIIKQTNKKYDSLLG